MSTNEEANVKIGASTDELNTGMAGAEQTVERTANSIQASMQRMTQQVTGSISGMQSQIKGHFAQIGETVHKVTGAILAVSAVVAGGKAFKEVIGETVKWTGEAVKLSKALGITTEEASILNVALDDTFNSMDTMLHGASMITKTLKGNEDAFGKLGVVTRDQNGNYRATGDIMGDVNAKLNTLKEGTDRNVAGMLIYGRQWNEVKGLLKLNAEVMADAKQRAEELHLIVGPEGVKQAKAYKMAMKDIEDVSQSLKVQIGNAVLPAFIQLGAWFNSIGPQAIEIFKGALQGVITFVQYLTLGAYTILETVYTGLKQIVTAAITTGSVLMKILQGDFKGAIDTAKSGWAQMGQQGEDAFNRIAKAAASTNDSVAKMWGLKKSDYKGKPDAPDGRVDPDMMSKEKEKSRLPQWESDLEKMKEAEGNFFKDSKASDMEYWQAKLTAGKLNAEEDRGIRHKIFQLKGEIAREELAVELQAMKDRSEAAMQGSIERINIAREEAELIKSKYGEQSKEYAAMLREIDAKHREFEADQIKRQESMVDAQKELALVSTSMEEDRLNYLKGLGLVEAEEEIARLRQIEEQKFTIELDAMKAKAALLKEGSIERLQALNQIAAAEAKHVQKLSQLNMKAASTVNGQWKSVFSKMVDDMELAVRSMVKGTLTWSNAWRYVMNQVLTGFLSMLKKKIVAHLAAEHTKTAATAVGEATRQGIEEAGTLKSLLLNLWATLKKINNAAVAAAAGAYEAMSSIPWIGPALGAAAAAVTYVAVMGYGAMVASAAGGYDVPEDQMAMIHKKEMVLPAELSDKIRNMADPGPADGRGGAGNIIINAVDAKSVKRLFKENGGALANSIRNQKRNFSGALF